MLTADGVVSLIGCLMGNPFINAVYIGHPGWKAMGGRIGYSAATGLMVIVLSWFGIIALMLALIPVVAISPILLYIGMLIGAQAFQTTPKHHAPAIVLALMPHLAAWGKTLIDGALGAAGTTAAAVGFDKLAMQGVLYHGLEVMGGGAILSGLVLGAIGVFIIDREVREGVGLRAGGRGADLLRLHARRGGRHRGHALGGGRLRDGGGVPVRAEPSELRAVGPGAKTGGGAGGIGVGQAAALGSVAQHGLNRTRFGGMSGGMPDATQSADILRRAPVIPVLTIDDFELAVPLARALCDGGLPVIEVTLRTGRRSPPSLPSRSRCRTVSSVRARWCAMSMPPSPLMPARNSWSVPAPIRFWPRPLPKSIFP